jgi:hypothetical protein
MLEPIVVELGVYIAPPEVISTACIISPPVNNTNTEESQIFEVITLKYRLKACTDRHETWYVYHAT